MNKKTVAPFTRTLLFLKDSIFFEGAKIIIAQQTYATHMKTLKQANQKNDRQKFWVEKLNFEQTVSVILSIPYRAAVSIRTGSLFLVGEGTWAYHLYEAQEIQNFDHWLLGFN